MRAIGLICLDAMRASRSDEYGNAFLPFPVKGYEPRRCCLRNTVRKEEITPISYNWFTIYTPWPESGPADAHGKRRRGPAPQGPLPTDLRCGPRILRACGPFSRHDEHKAMVPGGQDIKAALTSMLEGPEVHLRPLRPQCFLYEATR